MTIHPASDSRPHFTPDGKEIAFTSGRTGRSQVHLIPVEGGEPRQVTFDSASKTVLGFTADGNGLLVAQGNQPSFERRELLFSHHVSHERIECDHQTISRTTVKQF